jgi:hypothetical protein
MLRRPAVALLLALPALAAPPPPGPPPPGIHFVDVAPRSAIAYRTNNGFTGRKWFPQPMAGGVAIADFDGDGRRDVFLTNGAKLPELRKTGPEFANALLRNRGDGTFEDVTARAGLDGMAFDFSFGAAAGDYDDDGRTDLFVAHAGRNALYHNEGGGRFTEVGERAGLAGKPKDLLSVGGAWLDYDQDGRLDLVVSQYTYWSPQTDVACRVGERESYCPPSTYRSVPPTLYRNEGGGRFTDVSVPSGFAAATRGKGMGVAVADVDADGRMDVFIANDTEPNFLFLNRGDGTFAESASAWTVDFNDQGQTVSGMGADAKDYDNDGRVDIFYNDLAMQVWGLFRNEGRGFLYASPATGLIELSRRFSGWSAGFVDYDNDGWKDLYSANGDVDDLPQNAAQHDTMFRNRGGRGFEDVSGALGPDFAPAGFQRGAAFGDLDDDGRLDLVVTSLGRPPRILMNRGPSPHHWLLVDTKGRRSNRDGIGAVLVLTTGSGRTLTNHVTTSVGFLSSSDKRVHFGLGAETAIRSLEVRWPSGIVQRVTGLTADRILEVEEPPS